MASITRPVNRRRSAGAKHDKRAAAASPSDLAGGAPSPVAWYRKTVVLALGSGLLLYAAFPPLGLWPLAWIAPIGLLLLVRGEKLPGRRPYLTLWAAGVVHSLLLFHFVRLPHWTAGIGWFALSFYLACYFPAFVAMSRVAVHRLRAPLIVAAPVVWIGLELFRGYFLTGLSAALLGHSQVGWTSLIQISDTLGAYGVSAIVMLVAAALASVFPWQTERGRLWPLAPAIVVLAAALLYGNYRLGETLPSSASQRSARVALVQGTMATLFDLDPQSAGQRIKTGFNQYRNLTAKVRRENPNLDLVVWPESMFVVPDVIGKRDDGQELNADERYEANRPSLGDFALSAQGIDPLVGNASTNYFLAGGHSVRQTGAGPLHYNTALLFDPAGNVATRYHKMHRAPFGEYIIGAEYFPWIYRLTPIPAGLTAGPRPETFEVAGVRFAPNICFESTVPHLIRNQMRQLEDEGASPDVLVNMTNDGWFHGSSALDLHLTCSVFRAVETRRPMLVAANTGISAVIDGNGRLLAEVPRMEEETIVVDIRPDGRTAPYLMLGDLPAWCCLALCGLLSVIGLWRCKRIYR